MENSPTSCGSRRVRCMRPGWRRREGGVVEMEVVESLDLKGFTGVNSARFLSRRVGRGLVKRRLEGREGFAGLVQFVEPRHWWALLNPFLKVRDEKGNRFFVRGLLGHVIALASAKRRQPAGVVCVKRAEKVFEVVRWF